MIPTEPIGSIPRPVSLIDAVAVSGSGIELQLQRKWSEVTLASIGDAVITTGTDGCVTYLNPVAEAMTGWKLADALGRPLPEVFCMLNEETRVAAANPIEKALLGAKPGGVAEQNALVARDGQEVSVEETAARILDSHGNVVGAVMVFHDVTRRRNTDRTLRAREAHLNAVFSQSAVGIAVADMHGHFQQVNAKFCALVGYTPDELREHTFLDITHTEDVDVTRAQLERLQSDAIGSVSLDKRCLRKDGRTIWCNMTLAILRNENGEADQFLGLVQDITERKQAEELVDHLAALVRGSDDAIISTDLRGMVVTWNPGAERLFGYSSAEATGNPIALLIPEKHEDEEPALLARLRRGERIEPFETTRRHKLGALLRVSMTLSPIPDERGQMVGASRIARDASSIPAR